MDRSKATNVRQFQISNLLVATALCALAIWSLPSPRIYFATGVIACFGMAIISARRKTNTFATTVIVAVLWANLPILCHVIWTVATQHREQGQLYDEDGPAAYLFVSMTLACVFSFVGSLAGIIIGALVLALSGLRGERQSMVSRISAQDGTTDALVGCDFFAEQKATLRHRSS